MRNKIVIEDQFLGIKVLFYRDALGQVNLQMENHVAGKLKKVSKVKAGNTVSKIKSFINKPESIIKEKDRRELKRLSGEKCQHCKNHRIVNGA